MRCDGAGKGYGCTSVDEPPDRHTRSPHQPPWSDEYHDIATDLPTVSDLAFEITNDEREQKGYEPVRRDPTLSQIACWHNHDMIGHRYLGHEDSDERSPQDRVAREHRRLIGLAGENALDLGFPLSTNVSESEKHEQAQRVITQWMESPGHRSNILNDRWTHLGLCVSQDSLRNRATQVFAGVQAYLDTPLSWAQAPGDSVSVSFSLVKAEEPPTEYKFVPAGQPLGKAYEGGASGKPLNDKIYFPDSTGTYDIHLLIPEKTRTYSLVRGPRVLVTEEPAYVHGL